MEKYIEPKLIIKTFVNSDIITASGKDSSSDPWEEDVSKKN